MKQLILLLCFCSSFSMLAQPSLVWSIEHELNGSLYAFGNTLDTPATLMDGDGNLVSVTQHANEGNGGDVMVLKHSNTGELLWQWNYNGSANLTDFLSGMILDKENNIIIHGSSITQEMFDYDIGYSESQTYVVKLSSDGEFLWEENKTGLEWTSATTNAITADEEGNIYYAATYDDGSDAGDSRIFKLNKNGEELWGNTFLSEYISNLKIIDNQLLALGVYNQMDLNIDALTLDLDNGNFLSANLLEGVAPAYNRPVIDDEGNIYIKYGTGSYLVKKFKQSGEHLWTFEEPTNLPSNVHADEARDIQIDKDGNVFITGRHYGENYGIDDLYTNGNILTVKLDKDGNVIWKDVYIRTGENSSEIGNHLVLLEDGSVFLTGYFSEIMGGSRDAVNYLLDKDGVRQWEILYDYGFDERDIGYSSIVKDNCIFVSGGVASSYEGAFFQIRKYDLSTGISSINQIANTTVFPNPSTGIVQLSESYGDLKVVNLNGRLITSNANSKSLDLRDEPAGIYFIHGTKEDGTIFTSKVMKQ